MSVERGNSQPATYVSLLTSSTTSMQVKTSKESSLTKSKTPESTYCLTNDLQVIQIPLNLVTYGLVNTISGSDSGNLRSDMWWRYPLTAQHHVSKYLFWDRYLERVITVSFYHLWKSQYHIVYGQSVFNTILIQNIDILTTHSKS